MPILPYSVSLRPLLIAACIAGCALLPRASWSQQACDATVNGIVEVAPGEFSLKDLLAGDTCPELLRAAARVPLGSAPFAGSMRVFDAGEIRALLQKVARNMGGASGSTAQLGSQRVPQRVVVRRNGVRASCADIGRMLAPVGISGAAEPGAAEPGSAEPGAATALKAGAGTGVRRDLDCGVVDRIPQGAPLEQTGKVWSAALDSWKVSLRCIHPGDCVPFLVWVRESTSPAEMAPARPISSSSSPSARGALNIARDKPLVRAGNAVTLTWDQDGIRLVIPAICLDPGGEGQTVRARIAPAGRVVRAIVVSARELRSIS